jgi:EmrB/QacA subfamily drug resistance transporter
MNEQTTHQEREVASRWQWWALGVLSLAVVVIGMDNFILNLALPTLVRELRATASQLQWLVDAYVVVFAGLLLTTGAVGDRFGRKRLLTLGLLVFVAASAASAWAGSAEVLIGARAALGVGAAMIFPATLSIVTAIFPPAQRGRAIGAWAAMAGLGIVLGPVVGGWLLDRFWWGSVFLINVPVVAVVLLAGWLLIPESKDPAATPLDPLGAVLSTAGIAALVYGLIEAPDNGWTDPLTLAAFALAVLLLAGFVVWQRRTPHPMLQLVFFRNPRFSAATIASTLAFFAVFGVLFVLTQHLQFALGYTPLQAGLRIMPVATLVVGAPLGARMAERLGTKAAVAAGFTIAAVGLGLLSAVDIGDGYGPVAWTLGVLGFGMGLAMAPAVDSIMGAVPTARAGVGSAMNTTTRQVGGALGVAVLGSVLTSAYRDQLTPALAGLPEEAATVARDSVGAALGVAARLGPAGGELAQAARAAFVDAMGTAAMAGATVALLGAVVALAFLPSRPQAEPVDAQHAAATTQP